MDQIAYSESEVPEPERQGCSTREYRYALIPVEHFINFYNNGFQTPEYIAIPVSHAETNDDHIVTSLTEHAGPRGQKVYSSLPVHCYVVSMEPVDNYLPAPFKQHLPISAKIEGCKSSRSWKVPESSNTRTNEQTYTAISLQSISESDCRRQCGFALIRINHYIYMGLNTQFADNIRPAVGLPPLLLPIGELLRKKENGLPEHVSILRHSLERCVSDLLKSKLHHSPQRPVSIHRDIMMSSVYVAQYFEELLSWFRSCREAQQYE